MSVAEIELVFVSVWGVASMAIAALPVLLQLRQPTIMEGSRAKALAVSPNPFLKFLIPNQSLLTAMHCKVPP